jgi:ABC-type histidine transport system ATPase subunit
VNHNIISSTVTGYGTEFAVGMCILVLQNCKNDEIQINQEEIINIQKWHQAHKQHQEKDNKLAPNLGLIFGVIFSLSQFSLLKWL